MRAFIRASVTALSIAAIGLTATAKEARAESPSTESAATQGQNENHEETPQERRERRERRARREKEAADKAAAEAAAATAAASAPALAPVAPAAAATAAASVGAATPAPAATTAPVETSTPLSVIPSKPLNLESTKTPSMADSAWKLAALGIAAGLGVWAWKRKSGLKLEAKDEPEIKVLRRTALGNKNELVFVELDGQQILLGVTPTAISSLLIIPTSDASDPIPVEEPVVSKAKLTTSAIREAARMFPEIDSRDTDIQVRPRAQAREARPARGNGRDRDRDRKPRDVREIRESRQGRDDQDSPADIVLREDASKPTVTSASALARIEGQAEGLMRLRRNA